VENISLFIIDIMREVFKNGFDMLRS